MEAVYYQEIEHNGDYIEVEFTGTLTAENDGIGHYEYWGAQCYDAGTNYLELQDVTWNEKDFTAEENASIQKYVDDSDNWEYLQEKMSEKVESDYDADYEPDYDRDFGGEDW